MAALAIFVLNLARDEARLAAMAEQLDGLGLRWRRIEAVDGRQMGEAELARVRPDPHHWLERRDLTRGEVGCALSHRAAWLAMIADGHESALVLEDDVTLAPDFTAVMDELAPAMKRYDLIKLEGIIGSGDRFWQRRLEPLGESRALQLPRWPSISAAAYALSARAARILLDETQTISQPIDHTIVDYPRHDLRYGEIRPFPARQDISSSNLAPERAAQMQARPTQAYRWRKRAHKAARRFRQWRYELCHVGLWTLWTPQPRLNRRDFLKSCGVESE